MNEADLNCPVCDWSWEWEAPSGWLLHCCRRRLENHLVHVHGWTETAAHDFAVDAIVKLAQGLAGDRGS